MQIDIVSANPEEVHRIRNLRLRHPRRRVIRNLCKSIRRPSRRIGVRVIDSSAELAAAVSVTDGIVAGQRHAEEVD